MLDKQSMNSKLTEADLEIHPQRISEFFGFNCEEMIFIYCCDQASSSLLFDKICLLARQLQVSPIIERYIPLDKDRPLIILSKLDFETFFNFPQHLMHDFSEEDKTHLYNQLLKNNSLLGCDHSLRAILTRVTIATIPTVDSRVSSKTETLKKDDPAQVDKKNKKRKVASKQARKKIRSDKSKNHTPEFFSPIPTVCPPLRLSWNAPATDESELMSAYNDHSETPSSNDAHIDGRILAQYMGEEIELLKSEEFRPYGSDFGDPEDQTINPSPTLI